jgi:hypothetical protein
MARGGTSHSRGRLPRCKWVKIITRSQNRNCHTKVRIVEAQIDKASGEKRVTAVWKDDGQKSTYSKDWLVKMWSRSKVCHTYHSQLHSVINLQAYTDEA